MAAWPNGRGQAELDSTPQLSAFDNFSGPRFFRSDAFRPNESPIISLTRDVMKSL